MIKNKGNAEDQTKKEKKKYDENRKQITSIIKGCSLVQFEYNCAVLCNHFIKSLKLQDFMGIELP